MPTFEQSEKTMTLEKVGYCSHCGLQTVFPSNDPIVDVNPFGQVLRCVSCRCLWVMDGVLWERGVHCDEGVTPLDGRE